MKRTLFAVLLSSLLWGCSPFEPSQACSGDYSYEELATFFSATHEVFAVAGVQSIDHDEVLGCVVIGVLEGTNRSDVRGKLREIAVPLDAVWIKQEAPIILL